MQLIVKLQQWQEARALPQILLPFSADIEHRSRPWPFTILQYLYQDLFCFRDSDGELKLWDMVKRRPFLSARVHNPAAGVIGVGAGTSLGNKIVSQGRDGTVKLWELAEGCLSREPFMTLHTDAYHFCKLSVCTPASCAPDASVCEPVDASKESYDNFQTNRGSLLNEGKLYLGLAGTSPSMVDVWDIEAGKLAFQFGQNTSLESASSTESHGMCMALQVFTHLNREGFLHVIAGYEDGTMALWDARNSKIPCVTSHFHQEPVMCIALDGPCQGGVSGAADERLIFFSLDYQQNFCHMRKEITLGHPGTSDLSIRKDDKIMSTAGWDRRVRIYDYHRSRPLANLKYHADLVNAVSFSDDCKLLASASKDGTIALWSIYPPQAEL